MLLFELAELPAAAAASMMGPPSLAASQAVRRRSSRGGQVGKLLYMCRMQRGQATDCGEAKRARALAPCPPLPPLPCIPCPGAAYCLPVAWSERSEGIPRARGSLIITSKPPRTQKLQAFNEQFSQKRNAYNKQAQEKNKKRYTSHFTSLLCLQLNFLFDFKCFEL